MQTNISDSDQITIGGRSFDRRFLIRITSLGLSVRATNACLIDDVVYVGDLVTKLLRIPNIGRIGNAEIMEKLEALKLARDMKIPGWSEVKSAAFLRQFREKAINYGDYMAAPPNTTGPHQARLIVQLARTNPSVAPHLEKAAESLIVEGLRADFVELGMELTAGRLPEPVEEDLTKLAARAVSYLVKKL